ncbi:MAG: hypothetical protein EOM43_02785 [Gammaproteobacteria bacterium]|nr:hypothetical protein [Gammaproteobacteria bacterium]
MTLSNTYATEYSKNEPHIVDMLDGNAQVEFNLNDPTIAGGFDIRLLLLRELQIDHFLRQSRNERVLGKNILRSVENVQALGYINLLDAITDNAGDDEDRFFIRLCVAMTTVAFQQYFIAHLGDDLLQLPAIKDLPLPDPEPFLKQRESLH